MGLGNGGFPELVMPSGVAQYRRPSRCRGGYGGRGRVGRNQRGDGCGVEARRRVAVGAGGRHGGSVGQKAWAVIDLGEGGRGLRMERASGDVLRGPGPDMAVHRRRRTAAHQGLVGVTKSHQRLIIQRLWPQ